MSHAFDHAFLDTLCRDAGAIAWGVAAAGPVEDADHGIYAAWISSGGHGCLQYMERYPDVRSDPRLLLEGARSIVVCAFSYRRRDHNPWISDYALGGDYHTVLRECLAPVGAAIERRCGGATRVCVDSAPLRERYWAERAGVGRCGLSGKLLVPGAGSEVFLAEILTTAAIAPTSPLDDEICTRCGRCVQACPAGALDGRGRVDASRCLSCLTVEWRGPLPPGTNLHGRLAGCDVCSRVCPLSQGPATSVPGLQPRAEILAMTPSRALALTRGTFKSTFAGTALMRLRLDGLQRNARLIEPGAEND
ncbi:MAG: DUF1730 domain-containing protein [Muribaculaceae bacterium]|nr:DUF1730 domain-containing protein [Muribaculaceae bacterium]